MGFLLRTRERRIKTPPPLHAFRLSPLPTNSKGFLMHTVSVFLQWIACVEKRSKKRCEEMSCFSRCVHGPRNVKNKKRDSTMVLNWERESRVGSSSRSRDIVVTGPSRWKVWRARTSLQLSALGVELVSQCKLTHKIRPNHTIGSGVACMLQSPTNVYTVYFLFSGTFSIS